MKKLDGGINMMNFSERGQEIQRLRNLIRTHKRKKGNARCWLNDKNLYEKALPEGSNNSGRMDLPEETLLKNCRNYIAGQKKWLSVIK